MKWIISSSLRLRSLVVVCAAILLIMGIWNLRDTSLDVVPEFSPLSLQVRTEALGLSPAEVEALITVPLEADLLTEGSRELLEVVARDPRHGSLLPVELEPELPAN